MVLIFAFSYSVFAAVDSQTLEKLNLDMADIQEATVYYERSLKPRLPVFEKTYKQFLAQENNVKTIIAKKQQIISDINRILGITDPNTKMQDKVLTLSFELFPLNSPKFYLITRKTIKDFMRAGGQLPGFTYDKAADTVTYQFAYEQVNIDSNQQNFEVVFPVSSMGNFEQDVRQIFQALQSNLKIAFGIHETVEMSLLQQLKPADAYYRWFSDGLANAVTCQLLEKYVGTQAAANFAAVYDVNKYKNLQSEINLQYWVNPTFCIKTPLDYEDRLRAARYAFATFEARRLIEKHGIDSIRMILDKIRAKKSRSASDLFMTVKAVTTEDMERRLLQYQSFGDRQQGKTKYVSLYKNAAANKDYTQMIINLLRLLEFEGSHISQYTLELRKEVSCCLYKLGYEKAGDEAMLAFMDTLKNNADNQTYDVFSAAFIVYALECNNPQKAKGIAEDFLKKNPDHPPALTVQMKLLADSGKFDEARIIAKRILSLIKDSDSIYYRAASEILTSVPNPQQK